MTDPESGKEKGMVKVVVGLGTLALVALAVVLVMTELPKWTCAPPDGVWVEASDRCVDLP